MVHKEVVRVGWDQIGVALKFVFVSNSNGYMLYVRIGVGILLLVVAWLWWCKADIDAPQHAVKKSFGVIKFRYFDGLENTPKLRPKWYQLLWAPKKESAKRHQFWRRNWTVQKIWLKAKHKRWRNSRDAKKFRNSPDGNKPHELKRFGTARIYGPGWYTTPPKQKGISFITEDTRNRIVGITLYVKQPDGFEVFVLPIQLTIRIADLYLWLQASNNTEGGIMGDLRTKSWEILDLGYDVIRTNPKIVGSALLEAIKKDDPMIQGIGWYGGEVVFIKPAPPEYQSVSLVAQSLSHASPLAPDFHEKAHAIEDLDRKGAAVTVTMSIDEKTPSSPPTGSAK